MKNRNKLNLNINKDDHNLNDYLYSWSEIESRPSKITLHGYFDTERFLNYLNEINHKIINSFTDIVPSDSSPIINQKQIAYIESGVFISFTHFDKNEESLIGEVCIIYDNKNSDKVENISDSLMELIIKMDDNDEDEDDSKVNNLKILSINQNMFDLEDIELDNDFEDMDSYYEKDVIKKTKKVIKSLKKEDRGLTIISGDRGCGKTTLTKYITSKVDKNFVFIPCNLLENTINNSEFRKFLKLNKDCVLVIDDCELYFNQMYSKSTFYTNNLLQLVDGIHSKTLNVNIILVMNCKLSDIDKNLSDSNNIIEVMEVGELSISKLEELSEQTGIKLKSKKPLKIVDFIKGVDLKDSNIELGFK